MITPASPPGAPSYPNKSQAITLALIFGLFLGVGGAVAKDKLNGGFATPGKSKICCRFLSWLRSVS